MADSAATTQLVPRTEQGRHAPWVRWIPDGAVSVEVEGGGLALRASVPLQTRFEELLEGRKAGTLTPEETQEFEAICNLDETLSWLNRLARSSQHG